MAEDERELSDALAAILTHHSFSVDAVYNGNDAYDYGSAENYAGILMDVMMPGMSGVEVVRRLRAEGVSTPVLMLTAKSETEDIVTGLDSGADDYLTKPFEMPVLLARVRALVPLAPVYIVVPLVPEMLCSLEVDYIAACCSPCG